jgi:hypothetical protein
MIEHIKPVMFSMAYRAYKLQLRDDIDAAMHATHIEAITQCTN